MIITCNECSSSFNFDYSLIKENGSKVRCSVCKNIFTVYPLPHGTEGVQKEWFDVVLDQAKDSPVSETTEWGSNQKDEDSLFNDDFSVNDHLGVSEDEIFLKRELTEEENNMLDLEHSETTADFKESDILNNPENNPYSDEEEYTYFPENKKEKSVFSTLIFIIVIIFFLSAGTWLTGILTGYKIPYISDIKIPIVQKYIEKIIPKESASEPAPVLNKKVIADRFMTNTTAGVLLIITGQVDNETEETFNYIELEVTLASEQNGESIIKKVFCGNVIPDEMLRNGDIAEIEKLLTVREGQDNSNEDIKPGLRVPFMVVFSELPDKLKTYYIKVIGFEKSEKSY